MNHRHPSNYASMNRSFGFGILLNIGFVIVEAVFGVLTGSLALLADAGHNASDVIGLLIAWVANLLSSRPFNERHTYGWRSFSIIAALINALILIAAVGVIIKEAVGRLLQAETSIASGTIIWVALVGTGINLATAFLFRSNQKKDLNIRGAFIHMAADAGVSAGVVIAAVIIRQTGWNWLDPVISLLIAGIIFWSTWGLLKDAFHLLMSGVPDNINIHEVRAYLEALPGVENVHDLHIWAISTQNTALTAHLVIPSTRENDTLLTRAARDLHEKFEIDHSTLQIESSRLDDEQDDE